MPFIKKAGLLLMAMLILGVCGCGSTTDTTSTVESVILNVSASIVMKDVITEINNIYSEAHPWCTFTNNFTSAGTIQKQIENGAPCDVFISAASAYMDNLQNQGLLLENSRQNLLANKIVLIVPSDSKLELTSFEELTKEQVKLIAIGDPKSVSAGGYAQQVFDLLGITLVLEPKLILANDVRQVLTYVDSGNVDAGVVFATDALSSSNVTVIASGPDSINSKIVYPVSIIKASTKVEAAQEYLEFLKGAQAKAIFEKYGFLMAAS